MSKNAIAIERANTVLYCATWAPTVAFYRETIGLEETFANDWFVEFRLAGTAFISIADAARTSVSAVGGQGVTVTLQVTDVDAVHALLASRDVELTPVRERWGARVTYCHDPEGHRIEFWSENQ